MSAQHERLRDAACGQQAPPHPHLARRGSCNRPAGHTGPHQRIRAGDFLVRYSWDAAGMWVKAPPP